MAGHEQDQDATQQAAGAGSNLSRTAGSDDDNMDAPGTAGGFDPGTGGTSGGPIGEGVTGEDIAGAGAGTGTGAGAGGGAGVGDQGGMGSGQGGMGSGQGGMGSGQGGMGSGQGGMGSGQGGMGYGQTGAAGGAETEPTYTGPVGSDGAGTGSPMADRPEPTDEGGTQWSEGSEGEAR